MIELETEQLNKFFSETITDDERREIIWKLIEAWSLGKETIDL